MTSPPLIKVLFAIPALDHAGPDRVIFELLRGLDRRRFSPSLLVSEPEGHYLRQLPGDVPVHILGITHGSSIGERYPLLRALRFVREVAPDVVLATLRMSFTIGAIRPALRSGTRVVLRQANDLTADFTQLVKRSVIKHRVARALTLVTLRGADAVVCQSRAMSTDLRALLGDRTRLEVISNPIDVDAVGATVKTHTVDRLPGSPSLVSVGRLAHQKGFDLLLDALAMVRRRHPGVHLTIYGDGPDRDALHDQARKLGVDNAVTFAGFSRNPIPHIATADLFVLASRYEGFPNAALEALACGTPAVLTDCPGANSEIIAPGANGQLAASPSAPAMADAIERAVAELTSYDRNAITAECRRRYGAPHILGEYERMLASVVRGDA